MRRILHSRGVLCKKGKYQAAARAGRVLLACAAPAVSKMKQPATRAGRVLLPFAAWKNGPSAAALTIPGVGWGLPGCGEPTGHHRGFADRRPRTHRRRRSLRLRDRFTSALITRLIGRGDATRSLRPDVGRRVTRLDSYRFWSDDERILGGHNGGKPSRVADREVSPSRWSEKRREANLPRRSAALPPSISRKHQALPVDLSDASSW